jgi:starch synthase (maltosyl-transferring)
VKKKAVPIIFNLFPRYFPSIDTWSAAIPHVRDMGFNWIFVNPFHETGFSGSQYAIKDYYRINPPYLPAGADGGDWSVLKKFISACKKQRCNVMMDLVINHTAFDSVLVAQHPEWYRRNPDGTLYSPRAIDPGNADNVTIWGDLAEIDNNNKAVQTDLKAYWNSLVAFFQKLGVAGFRCDAAYKVSADMWTYLIGEAKKRNPDTVFLAETLGCRLEEIDQLYGTGFDYLYNSSKYWNFDQPWCVEQHERNKRVAPSISFPESHDTLRLAAEPPGTLCVQQSRYLFASLFSEGVLMPMGYEFGALVRMDVVRGSMQDVEASRWDLSTWIGQVNALKTKTPVLCEEGTWIVHTPYDRNLLVMEKQAAGKSLFVCINKDTGNGTSVSLIDLPAGVQACTGMFAPCADVFKKQPLAQNFTLAPAEILLFV